MSLRKVILLMLVLSIIVVQFCDAGKNGKKRKKNKSKKKKDKIIEEIIVEENVVETIVGELQTGDDEYDLIDELSEITSKLGEVVIEDVIEEVADPENGSDNHQENDESDSIGSTTKDPNKSDEGPVFGSGGEKTYEWNENRSPLKNEWFTNWFNSINVTGDNLYAKYEEFVDTGNLVAYSTDSITVNALFVTAIDTKNGTDIPPILTPSCSVDTCVYEDYFTYSDYFDDSTSVLDELQREFLDDIERLSGIFTMEEGREVVCEPNSFSVLVNAAEAELEVIEPVSLEILAVTDQLSAEDLEKNLPGLYDTLAGRLMLNALYSLCDLEMNTEHYSFFENRDALFELGKR